MVDLRVGMMYLSSKLVVFLKVKKPLSGSGLWTLDFMFIRPLIMSFREVDKNVP